MGFVRRVLSFLSFMTYALWYVLRKGREYDVVVASSGPLTLAVPALAGRWLRRLPFVFEVIDVWPDSAIAAGVLKSPVLKWLSFRLEAVAYQYASAIVTCSTGMTERVQKKLGVKGEELGVGETVAEVRGGEGRGRKTEAGRSANRGLKKVVTLSNCCDLDQFVMDVNKRRKTRERLGARDDQTVVLYTGAMGLSNAISDLVEAIRATAEDKQIIWWFAGDGREADKLRVLDEGEAGRCRFFGSLAKEQLVELYLAADVNVVTFMHEPLFYENSPNKFFDGIAAGLPAVFNRTTWLEPWLERYGCGIVCTSEHAGVEMGQQLKLLAADVERRQRMSHGARQLAADVFSRDHLAAEYLEILKEIAR
jgi:glycosyltransferase involved in cell wall biosynthesis